MEEQELFPTGSPIFIHGMWRSGTTYIWNKFRDQPDFHAFFEPLNERLWQSTRSELNGESPAQVAGRASTHAQMRHPGQGNSFFTEYTFKAEGGIEHFEKYFSFERYCLDENSTDPLLEQYLRTLICQATQTGRRAVLKFNRGLLRTGWLTLRFAPLNILILRHPDDIWSSFLSMGDYFVTAICLIVGQNAGHPYLHPLAMDADLPFYRSDSVLEEWLFYRKVALRNLDAIRSMFHDFYLLACVHNLQYADHVLDMNQMSTSAEIRNRVTQGLSESGIRISFEDCRMPTYPAQPENADVLKHANRASSLRKRFQSVLPDVSSMLSQHQAVMSDYFKTVFYEFALR